MFSLGSDIGDIGAWQICIFNHQSGLSRTPDITIVSYNSLVWILTVYSVLLSPHQSGRMPQESLSQGSNVFEGACQMSFLLSLFFLCHSNNSFYYLCKWYFPQYCKCRQIGLSLILTRMRNWTWWKWRVDEMRWNQHFWFIATNSEIFSLLNQDLGNKVLFLWKCLGGQLL